MGDPALRKLSVCVTALLFGCIAFLPANCFAQSPNATSVAVTSLNANESSSLVQASPFATGDFSFYAPAVPSLALTPAPLVPPPPPDVPVLSRFGVGVKVSTLGAGVEAAFKVIPHLNIRGGFNDFSYSDTINTNGFSANANLLLRSVEGHVDYFLIGPLHISGGALFYNDNNANGSLSVTGGDSFTLNHVTYYSDPSNPVTGTAMLGLNKAAPEVTFGLGNLVGRHHFSINFEAGVVFQGSPSVGMNLAGTACTASPCVNGVNTINAATDPGLQANLTAQRQTYSNDLKVFKYYPIISLGFSFRL